MREERFAKNEQGEWVLAEVIEHQPESDGTPEGRPQEEIAAKEAQLLAMYNELEALKAAQNG